MKRIGALIAAALLCVATVAAALAAGDAAKGEAVAAKGCACHKSKADLNGKDAAMLLAKMKAFKEGQGENKAMITIMKKYADQDMDDLAAYYASLPAK
jgi:cytochrome c553